MLTHVGPIAHSAMAGHVPLCGVLAPHLVPSQCLVLPSGICLGPSLNSEKGSYAGLEQRGVSGASDTSCLVI